MADSAIGSLPAVQVMQNADLFVLEQNGVAMKLSGELLASFIDRQITVVEVKEAAATADYDSNYIAEGPDAGKLTIWIPRGVGIASIQQTGVDGLNKTYTITWEKPYSAQAATTQTFVVKDGNAITSIEAYDAPHIQDSLDHYKIHFSEGNAFDFYVHNGADGNGSPGTATPKMDGTAAVGTAVKYAREDHRHQSDTSRQAKMLKFEGVDVTGWGDVQTPPFPDFPKRGTISCQGVTSSMYPIVTFDAADATSGIFAPVAECGSNKVYVYAADLPASTVTVKSVVVLP